MNFGALEPLVIGFSISLLVTIVVEDIDRSVKE